MSKFYLFGLFLLSSLKTLKKKKQKKIKKGALKKSELIPNKIIIM